MEDPLNLENRRKIYRFISEKPGSYLREMERELGMKPGLLSYHLDYLEKRELIRSEDDGYRRRYFVSEDFGLRDRKIVSLLRQESPRKILLHILVNGESSFSELKEEMGVAKSTLSYHLKKLTKVDIILSSKIEREKYYDIDEREKVADLIISLKDSLEEDAVDRFADIWSKLGD